jgi:hypothetical protein
MRRLLIGLTALGFIVALSAPALAKVETVKGQLIDQGCYKMNKVNTGNRHEMKNGPRDNCATECARDGHAVALLTSDGKVYQVTGDVAANKNEKLVGHMAHTVEVTGDVTTAQDGSLKIAGNSLKMISK